MAHNLISGIEINAEKSEENLFKSPAITTALIPFIGYHKATELSKFMQKNQCTLFEANQSLKLFDTDYLQNITGKDKLLQTGYRIEDLI